MVDVEFQIGDAVRLKSGGPRMEVAGLTQTDGKPQLVCVWFDQKRREATRTYEAASMKHDSGSLPDLAARQRRP
jgi:uncharacterized protein YodC (DUF2158 family)